MPTPDTSRQPAEMNWTGGVKTKPTPLNPEWRCTRCEKLLGVCRTAACTCVSRGATSISLAFQFRPLAAAAAR